jgi:DNA-binding transcriptional LysR family regulator
MELGNSEAIKQAVLSDLGISCLSLKVIEENLRNRTLTVLDTPELDLKRTLYIISHREKYWTPLLRAFGDHCGLKYSLGRDQGHAQHHG